MKNLFDPQAQQELLGRLGALSPGAVRQWGKMDAAQMLAHCSVALEAGTGDKPRPHQLIGKIFGPFVRKGLLGEKPFSRNSPTDPTFVVADAREFAAEKDRLIRLVDQFCKRGRDEAGKQIHSFLPHVRRRVGPADVQAHRPPPETIRKLNPGQAGGLVASRKRFKPKSRRSR